MSENQSNQIPTWFWIVSAVALIWNLMGVGAFVQQMTMNAESLAALPEAEQALYTTLPIWVKIAFGAAVFGGALGCIGLLLKKGWALLALKISLAGIIIQMVYNFFIAKMMDVYGPGSIIMPIMVLVIAVFLIWLAKKAIMHRWIS